MTSVPLHLRSAALAAALALGGSLTAGSPGVAQQSGLPLEAWGPSWDARALQRYEECVDKISTDASTAFEDALIFRSEGGGVLARHCVALALLELGHVEEAASRLEETAYMPDGGDANVRAELLSQAGNAWLLARAPIEAEQAFTAAMTVKTGDADLFIDRARAHALQSHFADAVSDLTVALTIRPRDVLALRLRANAHFELGQLDQAEHDVEAALAIDPHDIDTLVERGRLREARRLGIEAMRDPSALDRTAAPAAPPNAPAL